MFPWLSSQPSTRLHGPSSGVWPRGKQGCVAVLIGNTFLHGLGWLEFKVLFGNGIFHQF